MSMAIPYHITVGVQNVSEPQKFVIGTLQTRNPKGKNTNGNLQKKKNFYEKHELLKTEEKKGT